MFVPLTFVGNHDVTRLASLIGERHIPHALAILFTCAGTPSIYAGDEQAFRGIKENRAGGDDAVRPAFPAKPEGLASFGWPAYRLHQTLIGLRRRNPWLHTARTRIIHLGNARMTLEAHDGAHRLVVALNLGDTACVLPTPHMTHLAAGQGTLRRADTANAEVILAPHGWAILAASTDG